MVIYDHYMLCYAKLILLYIICRCAINLDQTTNPITVIYISIRTAVNTAGIVDS